MRKILKFNIEACFRGLPIEGPEYLVPLSVGDQNGNLVLWAECEGTDTLHKHNFTIFGTGRGIPDDYTGCYVGSITDLSGFVWHVYKD